MRLFPVLALLLPALATADEAADDELRLSVKPVLCITDSRNPSCDLSFLVVWQSGTTGYYCLFNDFGEAPLHCWNEQRTGRLSDDRSVQQNFSYWMTGRDPAIRLAAVDVEVLRLDSDDRRRKRRTRHVWDIN
jgi:Protein of unknown function (DUF3019)